MTGTAIADISHIPVSQGLSATLARASEGARASGAPEVSLEHVLAALCDDTDAADVLIACHVDTARLKSDVIRFLVQQSGGGGQPVIGPVTVSPALVRILEAAAAAARGGRKRDINGAIVLAAVVGDGRSIAAQILQDHGLTFDEAIKALQAAQTQPARVPTADAPPPAEDVLARARERVQSRAAPSLRDMMARPQLAERPAPAPGFPDIVPASGGAQPWSSAPADAAPSAPPAEVPAAPMAEQPARFDTTIAPVPEPEPMEPQSAPMQNAEADAAPAGAAPEVSAAPPVMAPGPKPEPPADLSVRAEAPSPRVLADLPAPPAQPVAPAATPPAPQPEPTPPMISTPPAGPAGMAQPRWSPAGDLLQEPAPVPVVPAAPAAAPASQTGAFPSPAFPAPTAAPAGAPVQFPPPSAFPPPAGMPPLPGSGSQAMPPPQPPPAPLPGGFAPNQTLPGFPPQTPPGTPPPFSPYPPPMAPQRSAPPPSGAPFGFEAAGRVGPRPPPLPPATPASAVPPANPYGVPPSAAAPHVPPPAPPAPAARSAATPAPRRDAAAQAELGQLAENIPRTMRAGVTERVEIRLARAHVHDLTGGMDGGGLAWRHDVTVTKALSVRLRAPEGGFFIESASPETQWIDNQFVDAGEDYASWRFLITPHTKGWSEIQIVVSARTIGSDGLAAETAFPDQRIDVKVRTNYGRAAVKGLGWAVAAIAGGAIAKFGEGAFEAGSTLVAKLLG